MKQRHRPARALATAIAVTAAAAMVAGCNGGAASPTASPSPALRTYVERAPIGFAVAYDGAKLHMVTAPPANAKFTFAFLAGGPTYRCNTYEGVGSPTRTLATRVELSWEAWASLPCGHRAPSPCRT